MKVYDVRPISDPSWSKGLAAPFCGVVQGLMTVAGGFGQNQYCNGIWVKLPGLLHSWKRAGSLPEPAAFGASFQMEDALVVAGGSDGSRTLDKVYEVRIKMGKAVIRTLPQLPVPLEKAGFTREGDEMYLVGGYSGGKPQKGIWKAVYPECRWERIAEMPSPLLHPLAFAAEGSLYVWGTPIGAATGDKVRGESLSLDSGKWSAAPSVPVESVEGATSVTLPSCKLIAVGGMGRQVLSFNPSRERWIVKGTSPAADVKHPGVGVFDTKSAVVKLYVAGGEIKPGEEDPRHSIFEL